MFNQLASRLVAPLLMRSLRYAVPRLQASSSSLLQKNRFFFSDHQGGCCGGKKGCHSHDNNHQPQSQTKSNSCGSHEKKGGCATGGCGKQGCGNGGCADHQKQGGCANHEHGKGGCGHHHKHDHAAQEEQHVHGPGCSHHHQQPEIPQSCLTVHAETHVLDNDVQVETAYTQDSISVLSNIKGAKANNSGELYVLMFTCNKCETRSIRSFTKTAYHQGVVLIRCSGCQNVHLIADNLGWFTDQPSNVETLAAEKTDKVVDPAAVTRILKSVFDKHSNHDEVKKEE